jgi:hypothetical protein
LVKAKRRILGRRQIKDRHRVGFCTFIDHCITTHNSEMHTAENLG